MIGSFKNGNFRTTIFEDGTKIRFSNEDIFIPNRPENIDIKITNYCDAGCPYCHEDSTINGIHGNIINSSLFDTIEPYTELAIGGGNPLSHPDLIPFLEKLKEKKVIANITVNQKHFMQNISFLKDLTKKKLIWGLGVSLIKPDIDFIQTIKMFSNAVIHIIYKIVPWSYLEALAGQNLKILILGYKTIRRGKRYQFELKTANEKDLYNNLPYLEHMFDVVSFDNLAIKQLEVERLFKSREDFERYYMGNDGDFSFYIDMVKEEYALNSTNMIRYVFDNEKDNIVNLWKQVCLMEVKNK